jgi:hypothetical protein
VTLSRGPYIRHHASHAQLVGHGEPTVLEGEELRALDAIVVPASRPAYNLDHAITLARAARCRLVILCSRDTRKSDVHALLGARSFSQATVVKIPRKYSHKFFEFETTDWIKEQLPGRNSDLSVKRNVGLVLARMLGWERIFFLDDDIRDLDAVALRETVSLLHSAHSSQQSYYSVGMFAPHYPDNSVVCHARRVIGEFQDVFVSGSALAVDCTVPFAFFPDIYNEDWLFFYRDAVKTKLGSSRHTATQLRYDPFANPMRAANEEFGDVIAEGLYALLEEDLKAEHATVERWGQFLSDRKRILDDIIERSDKAPREAREKMKHSVQIARKCLAEIQPEMCVEYTAAWQNDLKRWGDRRDTLPRVDSMSTALQVLGLFVFAIMAVLVVVSIGPSFMTR